MTDFGLAKRTERSASELTNTGAVLGTPAYMSPGAGGKGNTKFVGPQADVWALGVLFYELLTGTPAVPRGRPRTSGGCCPR